MNANLNKLHQDKIELISYPYDQDNINLVLAEINSFFHDSEQYQNNKEYQLSIASLKKAFEKTFELHDIAEQECAKFFRLVIIESLKNIHHELKKMTSGFFRKHHYKGSYIMAEETLKQLKKIAPLSTSENYAATSAPSNRYKSSSASGDRKLTGMMFNRMNFS